jgi:hypothetical protein
MSILAAEARSASASSVTVTDDTLTVELTDGRTISVPLAWYPRLLHGSAEERGRWRPIGQGHGLHWPDLDEDISVKNLLDGKPSDESQRSFRDWLDHRAGRPGSPVKTQGLLPKMQGLLPENMETITISSLMEDESVYVVPWSIVADHEGRLWIQGDMDFRREPAGTSHVRITRSGENVFVEKDTIGDYTYQRYLVLPEGQMLPVVLR